MRAIRIFFALSCLMTLAGCGTALVAADRSADIGNGISVMPQRAWNRIAKEPETWTTQGPQIDMVRFFSGIRSGSSLLSGISGDRLAYDSKMLPNDIQDLVVATLQNEGNKTIQAGNLAPCAFGNDRGFCFDLSFISAGDLEMKGLSMARKHNDRLDLILFQAPAEYYFGEMSADVKKLFVSVRSQ